MDNWTHGYKAFNRIGKKRKREIELLKALPNFGAEVFYEISGVRIDE